MKYTKEDIVRIVNEEDIEFIRLQFTDIFGQLKNVAVTKSQIEKVVSDQIMIDGSSIEGFTRIHESDQYLHPDLSTFAVLPWMPATRKTARLICNVYNPDGTPFVGDPRYVLRRALERAEKLGYTFNVGPEMEFFLFEADEKGLPTTRTADAASYFDMAPIDHGGDVRREICLMLEEMGFEIEASHHEVAEGQHEIDFKYADALTAADNISTFRMAVKTIAQAHGLHATFMPKPVFGINGSGMHVNMSLSYEAPCYLAWSASNRSALIRIPAARGNSTRVELRCPDPACNPYLALAVCLTAGLDGIEKGLTPPAEITENIYTMTEKERKAHGIASLPGNLLEAVELLEQDKLITDALGDHVFKSYVSGKRAEWDEYRTRVTDWETKRYMIVY